MRPATPSCAPWPAAIVSAVREDDVPARFGGEEFVVLLRNPGPGVAVEVGERIRAAVRALDLRRLGVPAPSVSIGVAVATSPDEAIESLIDIADQALYRREARRARSGGGRVASRRRVPSRPCRAASPEPIRRRSARPRSSRRRIASPPPSTIPTSTSPTPTCAADDEDEPDRQLTNGDLARIFHDIGDMLEVKGELSFKTVAYHRAADAIGRSPVDLVAAYRDGQAPKIPGVGAAISDKIAELATTGRMAYYDKLIAEVPPSLVELLRIPGLGPKTVRQIWLELGILSMEDLRKAAEAGTLRGLRGLSRADRAAHPRGDRAVSSPPRDACSSTGRRRSSSA